MAEPSTVSSAVATTLVSGAALSQILPLIDANAAFGAVIGAALVASTKKDLTSWKRFVSFLVSGLCGYGGAGEIVARELAKESFLPALIGAIVIVPLALKLLAKAPDIDLGSIFRGFGEKK
ncbi:putative holin [Achromobacter xylosoxidans]|uniref:putative holin n=1 Tax=Alcaligenes xylosoxydans xylosoxydans TaxID=85698 RepID=UPI002A75AFB6|nr:putative holin [Achromobacter xylosoxidans]WPQ37853.1 putative holin [Achromobacter xylosoxidans]